MSTAVWGVRGIYLAASVFAIALAGLVWRNRGRKGALPLSVELVGAGLWAFCLLVSTVPQEWLARAAIRVMYFPVGLTVAATLVFALEYTGRERYVTRRFLAALSVHPILAGLAALVNPSELFFAALRPASVVGVEQVWGPLFWVHSAYSYALILGYTVLLVGFIYRTRHQLYRGQAAALVLGISSPVPLNLIFLAGSVEFDTTPIGFVVASAFFAVAIVHYEYTNITPIAREKVITNVRDGMLVVGPEGQIVDSNPAAEQMLGASDSLVGSPVERVVTPEMATVFEKLMDDDDGEQTVSYGELYLRIESTPIDNDRGERLGWLFLLDDVTEQTRRERDLEQQIEKLDQFASLVSHDLRNPLTVAAGYIDQAKATGDVSYLDNAEDATERMEAIIEDVLALAREGQEVTDPSEVSLETVARAAWDSVETSGATLRVDADVTIVADQQRLQRLFENLYRNAVEHGASDEADGAGDTMSLSELVVEVSVAEETAATLTVVVSDNGTGIPEENVDQVFEDGFTTDREGTGLGLAIVKQIAGAHGWEIGAGIAASGGAEFEISGVRKPVS
ncbi:histidine kinase N-terminal 7TM domain-containing protein [Halovenus halobia]|uniref:histidine kinase N-terminal 7TM domain-containing protein n=1 Tax=Halovenus halobia TaxID=3396622 RepID=UPI003F56CA48